MPFPTIGGQSLIPLPELAKHRSDVLITANGDDDGECGIGKQGQA